MANEEGSLRHRDRSDESAHINDVKRDESEVKFRLSDRLLPSRRANA